MKNPAALQIARLLAVALLATACGGKGGSSSSNSNSGAPSLSYATNPVNFTVGVAAAPDKLQISNSVKSLSISPQLPAGLSFDETLGTVSGTPTTITPAANYVITGTNSYGSNFVSLQLGVVDVVPTVSYSGSTTLNYTVGTAITPISPTLGGGATTGCVSSPTLPPGLSLSSQCVLSGTPTGPVGSTAYTISAENSGGAASFGLTITVQDILPSISYSPNSLSLHRGIAMSPENVTNSGGAIISCASSPTLPSGISLSNTCQISGTPTALSSSSSYSITATNSGGTSTATITIGVTDLLPSISFSPSTRTLVRNSAVNPEITATNTGGVINTCTVSPSLPTGLSVSSTTCQVTGTPSVISSSTVYTFAASNSAGGATAQITLTVDDIGPSIQYGSSSYVFANLATISPVTPANSGGPVTSCTVSPSLPAALSLSSTCVISGSPSAASAAANYTITASNSGGSSTETISITISQVAPIIAYSTNTYTFNKTVPITPLTVTNTGGPIASCAVIPALPSGLSLSTSTCAISGTPTTAIAASGYTVTATNSAGSSSKTLTISVTDSPPAFTYPGSPYVLNLNQSVSTITPSSTGGLITSCSSSPTLPTGLALGAACGISGTPTALSSATAYTITGTNAGGSSTAAVTLSVVDHAPVISYAASPYNFPLNAAITNQTPANTGGTPTACSASPALPTGLSLQNDCTLTGTPTALSSSTSYTITGTNTGGSGSAAIVIAVSSLPALTYSGSPFSFTLGTSVGTITPTNSGAAATSCSSSPALPSGLNLSSTCVITGTPTVVASTANYTITATNASGNSNVNISVLVTGVPVLSYSNSPFTFINGSAITAQTPVNTGSAPTSCSASPSLPTGLSLSTTCVLSGTPSVLGTGTYTVTATNAAGSGTASITITVNDVAPAISYAGSPYTFNTGTAITSQTPANTGGSIVSCTSSPTLPTGLSLSSACVISGTPSVNTSATSFTITATNTGGSSSAAIVIAVSAVPALTYSGSPYSFTLNTSAGTITPTNAGGNPTSCTSNPSLPAGLTLASNCSFNGTPTTVSAATSYTITAVNSSGSANVSISIAVTGAPVLSYATAPFFFTKGSAVSAITPSNSGSTPTSCSSSPTLPAGLSLSTACVLSGTPTVVAALTSYTITGTNAAGSSNVTVGITVNDVAPNISYSGSPYSFAENTAIATQPPANTGGTITACTASPTLPTGLSLSATCVLGGTPTVLSSATSYTITASNSGGNFAVAISIAVNSAPVLTYSGSPFSFTSGTSVGTITPTDAGGPVNSCTVSPALPSGLSLANNCAISGTPTVIATMANYTITATNTSSSANVNVSMEVLAAPVLTYAGTPFTFTKGTAISAQTPTNSGSPATSCSSSPTLPAGLSLSATCVLSGTPTAVSAATSYTITGTNSIGSGTATMNITIKDVAPVIAYAGSPYSFSPNVAITSQTPSNTGGTATSCSISPTLPTGLSLSTDCVLSGTPTVLSAATSYTITATNTGGSNTASISIAVTSAPALTYSGSPYSFTVGTSVGTITPTNTGATVTSCSISPALPSGLSLSSSCVLTGTPTASAATGSYSVTATNSSGTSSVSISITVTAIPALTYSGTPFTFTSGIAITAQTPANTGSTPTSCSSSPTLPAGLSLSTACVLSGTPTAVSAATSYTISAVNSAGTGTATINITVIAVAPNISYSGSPYTFAKSTVITSQTPSNTGGTITSCTISPTLPTGLALSSTCVLSGTPTVISAAKSYTITATNSGGSGTAAISITVGSPPALTYSGSPYTYTVGTAITTATPTNTGAAVTACTVSPSLPAGLSLSSTCAISGTPTAAQAATVYTISPTNDSGSSSVNITITVNGQPILSYPNAPFAFTVGTPITSQTPTNTGSAATSCSSSPTLPAGLSLSATCVLGGTPTTPTTSASYTISGVNSVGTGTVAITIAVTAAAPNIAYAGSPYTFPPNSAITSQTPSNTGGTIVSCVSSPTLPTGLSLSATCVISGTPTAISSATSYTITATNTGGNSSTAISIAVAASPSLTYSGSPYTYTVGTAITTATPTNTGAAVTSCTVSPSLPAGLSLSTTCAISGTPTAASATTIYTLNATNSSGSSSVNISITVNGKPVLSYPSAPFAFTVGTAITTQTPTNTGSAATSCSSSPTLPAGLSLSATCVLSGTPTTPATSASYTISGVNSVGTGTVAITIVVTAAAPNIAYSGSPYQFPTGTAITSQTPSNTGGAIVSCASSPTLPAGLALSTACVISGTPTVVTAPTSYTITATNTGGTSSASITIGVGSTPALTYSGSPYSFTVGTSAGTITPTNTGSPATSCSSSPALPAGISLSAACVITGTPTIVSSSASYAITATNSAGSSAVTIVITVTSKPVLTYTSAPFVFTSGTAITSQTPTNSGSTATSCSSSPTLPTGLALGNDCTLSGTPTATSTATTYTISGTNATGTGTTTISITVNPAVPNISYAGTPYNFVKSAAITSQTPANTGGTITSCSSSPSLPTGLSISATCVISGTPTAITASASYTITATNAGGSGTVAIVIAVGAAPALTYSGSPYSYTVGTAITAVAPTNTGSAVTSCTITPDLPGGLTMNSTCGLSGTPTIASTSTIYTITATNSFGTANPTITIAVLGPPIISYPDTPYTFKQGTTIGPVAVNNTGSPATSCSSSPTLPTGLSLSTICTISGTPSGLTSNTYTITGTNSKGSGSTTVSITVTLTGSVRGASVRAPSSTDPQILFYSKMTDSSGTSGVTHAWTVAQSLTNVPANSGTLVEISGSLNSFGVDYDYPPVYSPDGTKIAFVSKTPMADGSIPGSTNLWIMNLDGSQRFALTQNLPFGEDNYNPVFSPDSTAIYFQSKASVSGLASQSSNIWRVDLTGENLAPLTSQTGPALDSTQPTISEDGKTIAFTSLMPINGVTSASTNIWTMDVTGGSLKPLTLNTDAALNSQDPSFSPDGSMILFSSQQAQPGVVGSGVLNIWEMQSTGWPQTELTSGNFDSGSPQMSLDGNYIVFVSKMAIGGIPSASTNVWEMNADGTSERYLTGNTASHQDSFFQSGSVWVQPQP